MFRAVTVAMARKRRGSDGMFSPVGREARVCTAAPAESDGPRRVNRQLAAEIGQLPDHAGIDRWRILRDSLATWATRRNNPTAPATLKQDRGQPRQHVTL
jgi:hypothetical protein